MQVVLQKVLDRVAELPRRQRLILRFGLGFLATGLPALQFPCSAAGSYQAIALRFTSDKHNNKSDINR